MKIACLTSGQYNIEFWNTFDGNVIESKNIEIKNNGTSFDIIPFTRDFAVKLKYAGKLKEGCGFCQINLPIPISHGKSRYFSFFSPLNPIQ